MSSNTTRRSQRKKQARLAFEPVEPSSSAPMSPARVTYEAARPRSKTSKLLSSQAERRDDQSGSITANTNATKNKRPTRNGKISFQPARMAPASSPGESASAKLQSYTLSDDSDSDVPFVSSNRRPRSVTSTNSISHPAIIESSDDRSSPELSEGPAQDRSHAYGMRSDGAGDVSDADQSKNKEAKGVGSRRSLRIQSVEPKTATRGPKKVEQKSTPKKKKLDGFQLSPEFGKLTPEDKIKSGYKFFPTVEIQAVPIPCKAIAGDGGRKNASEEEDEDDDDDDDPIILSSQVTRPRKGLLGGNEDDGNLVLSSPRKRRRSATPMSEDEDEEEPIKSSPTKRQRAMTSDSPERNEPSTAGINHRPSQSRSKKSDATPTRGTRKGLRKPHRTEKQKLLDKLRRKRAGEIIEGTSSSESDGEDGKAMYDTDSDLAALSTFEDEDEDEVVQVPKSQRASRPKNKEDGDEDEDDWIVEDEEALGIPPDAYSEIPLEFTRHAHKKLIEHFRDAIEWMVLNKLNPAFDRNAKLYELAFDKLNHDAGGFADSKYISSTWDGPFRRALKNRPTARFDHIVPGGPNSDQTCAACRRTNHTATFLVQFTGHVYDRNTLEEVESEDEEDDDTTEESRDGSEGGDDYSIPPASTTWPLGRTCKQNAEIAHKLVHLKYEINQWVVEKLRYEGHLTPDKIIQRDAWNPRKREKYAIRIVDEWWVNGSIKQMYGDFKNLVKEARETNTSGWRGR